jgi:hypothetical protein
MESCGGGRVPPSGVHQGKPFELEGDWSSGDGWAGSHLRFTARGSQYDVALDTSITLLDTFDSWTLKRTARIERGAIVFNRPVEDFSGIYTRLWALEVGPNRTVVLVPAALLADVRRAYKAGGCTYFNATFECRTCFERRVATRGAR